MSTEENPDLWPAEFDLHTIRSPRAICAEQAAKLGAKTRGIVTAELTAANAKDEGSVAFFLTLVAPRLNGYRMRALRVTHRILTIYPTEIWSYLERDINDEGDQIPTAYFAQNESELLRVLHDRLTSSEMKAAVSALYAQSKDLPSDDDIPF